MSDERMTRLFDEAISQHYTRRQVFKRALAIGMTAAAASAFAVACGGDDDDDDADATTATGSGTTATSSGTTTTGGGTEAAADGTAEPTEGGGGAAGGDNPLGVDTGAPLDVVIFKGGYGDEYAINAEDIYKELYPDADVSHSGIQRLQEQLQPRFVGGNPPDVIDNSGAGNLDNAALVAEGQLADLADLMAAPSYDTEGKTFAETLIPNSQTSGMFDGTQYLLNYAYTVFGIWYNSALFEEKGWTYPETWDEMMEMCETIKTEGEMAPWTYQGQYPYYMVWILNQMIYKNGGIEAIAAMDNLEPDAWRQPSVVAAVEAMFMLAENEYIMEGTEALSHTESQTQWLQGNAVFIPCGTWLENEMAGLIPEGFKMTVAPSPSLEGDTLPFEAVQAAAGEGFIVPSKGNNVQGGKEYIRLLFSKEGGRFFSEATKSLSVVLNSADDLDLGSAFGSARDVAAAAGDNVFEPYYPNWYQKLWDETSNQLGSLLTGRSTPDEFIDAVQSMADDVAADDSIKKYTREV